MTYSIAGSDDQRNPSKPLKQEPADARHLTPGSGISFLDDIQFSMLSESQFIAYLSHICGLQQMFIMNAKIYISSRIVNLDSDFLCNMRSAWTSSTKNMCTFSQTTERTQFNKLLHLRNYSTSSSCIDVNVDLLLPGRSDRVTQSSRGGKRWRHHIARPGRVCTGQARQGEKHNTTLFTKNKNKNNFADWWEGKKKWNQLYRVCRSFNINSG